MNRRRAREMAVNCQAKWEVTRRRMEPSGMVHYLDIVYTPKRTAERIKIDFTVKPWGVGHEPA